MTNAIDIRYGGQKSYDFSWIIGAQGRLFLAGDADQNDRVTGQTSFANTTPTFLLHNPSTSGVVCIPAFVQLGQAGTVAGGDINIEVEVNSPSAYASGGTAEKAISGAIGMTGAPTEACIFYTGATATAGYGITAHAGYTLAPDVSPAEGVINVLEIILPVGLFLWPDSSLNIFTYAGTTGPTWRWFAGWYELPTEWFTKGA